MKHLRTYENNYQYGQYDQKAEDIGDEIYGLFFDNIDDARIATDYDGEYQILVLFNEITDETLKAVRELNKFLQVPLKLEVQEDTSMPNKPKYVGMRIDLSVAELDPMLDKLKEMSEEKRTIKKFNL